MLNKFQFDQNMEAARTRQIQEIAEYLAQFIQKNSQIREMEIAPIVDLQKLRRIENIPISTQGRDVREVADELVETVFSDSMMIQHPRFFSFVTSAVSPYSLTGAILSDIYNVHGGGWSLAPGACLIEEKLIKWMAGLAGYPQETCGGLFVSGGSMANITALVAARECKLEEDEYPLGTAYISDQTHSSVAKGLRIIGFRKDQIVKIPTDDDFKMRVDILEEAILRDKADGKKPFVVIGSLGTTNTGSIDPLKEIGTICKRYDLWFHVDGAYGGSILISDIYRNYAKGVEESDSLSWDTHKWALQTYSCSSIIVRDRNHLLNAFTEHPEYLEDIRDAEHADPWNMGQEMTRPHRAIKLWVTLQAMGTDLLADVIDYSFYNTNIAKKMLNGKDGWQITSKPMCGTITFRYAPEGFPEEKLDALNLAISEAINRSGYAYIVTSQIKNMRILRMCLINGNTTEKDVEDTIERLDTIARNLQDNFC